MGFSFANQTAAWEIQGLTCFFCAPGNLGPGTAGPKRIETSDTGDMSTRVSIVACWDASVTWGICKRSKSLTEGRGRRYRELMPCDIMTTPYCAVAYVCLAYHASNIMRILQICIDSLDPTRIFTVCRPSQRGMGGFRESEEYHIAVPSTLLWRYQMISSACRRRATMTTATTMRLARRVEMIRSGIN